MRQAEIRQAVRQAVMHCMRQAAMVSASSRGAPYQPTYGYQQQLVPCLGEEFLLLLEVHRVLPAELEGQ